MAPLAIHRHARTTCGRLRPSSSRLSREGSGVGSTAGGHSLAATRRPRLPGSAVVVTEVVPASVVTMTAVS